MKNIEIKIDGVTIGVVQNLDIVGTPNTSESHIVTSRIRFNREQVKNAFDKGFINSLSQLKPLQIIDEDDSGNVTVYDGCWISKNPSWTYSVDDFVIVEAPLEIAYEKMTPEKE